jgi:uncharacterized FlaG/YvyC family protein
VKIKLPDAFFTPDSRSGFQPSNFSEGILQSKPNGSNGEILMDEDEYGILVALMEQVAELLSRFDRKSKYEVLENAEALQIQVIDIADGRIVRRISVDEVIKLVSQMREKMSDSSDL